LFSFNDEEFIYCPVSEKYESLNEFNMKLDDVIFMYFIGSRKNHKNPHR
jgi:hypothetical protein